MSTYAAAIALTLEASAIAIAYAVLGVGATKLRTLAAVIAAHAVVGAIAWKLAGAAGGVAVTRLVFAAEALAAFGLAAVGKRARLAPPIAAAVAASIMLVLVFGPMTGEPLAQAFESTSLRSAAYAVSPPYVASIALDLDVLHEPTFYGRFPAAVMEMHMMSWIWTFGVFAVLGLLSTFVARARRPRGLLVVALVALVAAGCKNKEDKPAPTTTTTEPAKPPETPKQPEAPKTDATAVKAAIDKGVEFLVKSRGADGMIGGHPGTTALAALAIAGADVKADDARLAPSLDALAKLAKPDGAIYDKDFLVYVTAIATLAFQRAGVHPDLVGKAQKWLADKQFAEKNGVDAKNPNYGGTGYGVEVKEPDADLSNMHFALDALKDSTLAERPDVLKRAQKFLERCQNRTESNDQKWAGNDGGFVYKPGASKAGGTASSGSMTYSGIAGFVYTQADAKDPRVAAAMQYIKQNYTVDENPGMGQKGLYYYWHAMGRALGLLGERKIVDAAGKEHDWPVELATKILSVQKPDGSWANADSTYWENNPSIATARAVLALEHALAAMK